MMKLCVLLTALAVPGVAFASQVAIGLNWQKGIFIQEYWQAGKVFYAIANRTDKDAEVACFANRDTERLAGPWQVKARAVNKVDAAALAGQGMLRFELDDGVLLGFLRAPAALENPPDAPVFSVDGLSGSGGRHNDVRVEQDVAAFNSGRKVELRLIIPGSKGELLVKQGDLPALEVACPTLTVTPAKNNSFSLEIAKPVEARDSHTVVVTFTAPKVERTTMLTFDSWLWERGKKGGQGITRGIIVRPESKASTAPAGH